MKKVRYTGELEALVPSVSVVVRTGDTVDVPDDFDHVAFEEIVAAVKAEKKNTKTEGDN